MQSTWVAAAGRGVEVGGVDRQTFNRDVRHDKDRADRPAEWIPGDGETGLGIAIRLALHYCQDPKPSRAFCKSRHISLPYLILVVVYG